VNRLERFGARALWRLVMLKLPFLKRWLPLVGTVVVVASTVAKFTGNADVAQAIDLVGTLTGATGQAGVTPTEIAGAVAAGTGVALKVWAIASKAWKAPSIR
jgi:hypothetical protein